MMSLVDAAASALAWDEKMTARRDRECHDGLAEHRALLVDQGYNTGLSDRSNEVIMLEIKDRQGLYTHFDEYSLARREELNQHSLRKGTGLLKAFIVETSAATRDADIEPSLRQTGWDLRQIDAQLYEVRSPANDFHGFVDAFSPRYLALFTTVPSAVSDPIVKRTIRDTVALDSAWFTSAILDTIWREFTPPDSLRFATLHYETEPLFDGYTRDVEPEGRLADDEGDADDDGHDLGAGERQTDRLEVRTRIGRLRSELPGGSAFGGLLSNLTRMRIPTSSEQGRCDYYHFGKVTNRGDEFRGFRAYLRSVVDFYGAITARIEDRVTFGLERHAVADGAARHTMRGALVTFAFSTPLSLDVFWRFIDLTFERGRGPFRLWGNPIRISDTQVHVYGVDLHLWQEIYLDMSPVRFLLVLPEGTCGNTVHRLASNLKRFIDPRVEIFLGDEPYTEIVRQALGGLT